MHSRLSARASGNVLLILCTCRRRADLNRIQPTMTKPKTPGQLGPPPVVSPDTKRQRKPSVKIQQSADKTPAGFVLTNEAASDAKTLEERIKLNKRQLADVERQVRLYKVSCRNVYKKSTTFFIVMFLRFST